jgi:diaminopimelate epimerase
MNAVKFYKMSGAGNDFVVLDNRQGALRGDLNAFSARVADRRRGVGADGVLLLERSPRKDFRMRYFNSDGSEADMCGNGGRCIARYAALVGAAPSRMEFENLAGDFGAEVLDDGQVRLQMTRAHGLRLDLDLPVEGKTVRGHSIDTGVPHLVVPVPDAAAVDVKALGRALRTHPAFAPKGTNVNFMQVTGKDSILVRTYERGVEDETLACGTGVVAAALLTDRVHRLALPLCVKVRGGDVLTVDARAEGDAFCDVTLTGSATEVFSGEIKI